VTFATSNTSAVAGFTNAGTVAATSDEIEQKSLAVRLKARWIRITSSGGAFAGIAAFGKLAPLPRDVAAAGVYVENPAPYAGGAFLGASAPAVPWHRRIVTVGNGMTAVRCASDRYGDAFPGTLAGRTWTFVRGSNAGSAVVNDDATSIVGDEDGKPTYLIRSTERPLYCGARRSGSGPRGVLVLDAQSPELLYPLEAPALPDYTFARIDAGMLDQQALAGNETALFNGICDTSDYLTKPQSDALLLWVRAGHKLLLAPPGGCATLAYAFIPYAFAVSSPTASGAAGDHLTVVESDALGSTDANDAAHYFDPQTYVNAGRNQLGDAVIATSDDARWCAHLAGTNSLQAAGYPQMYARYGKGIIIFDGFNHDDASNPGYERLRALELALPPAGTRFACTHPTYAAGK
jgi:hypothetical protein